MMIVQRLHDEAIHALSAMIVADTPTSSRQFKAAIRDYSRIEVRCTARTIASAIAQAAEHRPDVVFLDVAAADGESIADVARHFAPGTAIVVVADRPDFAFAAFECGAIDYLLKPIQEERLRATLRRIERFFAGSNEPLDHVETGASSMRLMSTDRVPIPSRQSTRGKTTDLVPVADVIWVESLQNYSVVQLPGSDRRSIKRTLTEWEAVLPEREFIRIGRFHLIQVAKLEVITSPSRNEWLAHFHDVGQPLRLGRAAASKLKGILRGSCSA